jgi:hypothetical protein
VSLQFRFLYDKGGNRVYGDWYDITAGEYYCPNSMTDKGWKLTLQVRETDWMEPPQPDSKRSKKREAAIAARKYRVKEHDMSDVKDNCTCKCETCRNENRFDHCNVAANGCR